ncbi:hypothetical protein G7Z17_g13099 [Cylindrodendrum hubeiense]|uniref:Alpha/beta hydrolase fold-3 domain-containing protein n=1 Tax=Cylindrodendrum hubeiense TaxID=595255 RepID=A0A9P5L9M4_9HYPO|nr:hypothetical protein G7Z17_g13099 [Cylindrodendrum hubeiense]
MSHTIPPTATAESSTAILRPRYDPLLMPAVEAMKASLPEILNIETLRGSGKDFGPESVLDSLPDLEHSEYSVPGPKVTGGNITLSVFKYRASTSTNRPALYHVHGGGQIAGNRFTAVKEAISYFEDIDAVFISVEYRLSPEHPAPAALHDAYAGLVWTAENAAKLGIDGSKIILYGCSGGSPIAAGTAMLCRNSNAQYPHALMLLTPMLDDRDTTVSSKQFARDGPWCGTTNRMAWDLVLGKERGGPSVSELVSPARATDLVGMPPTFIDVGECEVFRDEAVAFASQLWKCGVSAELHVWPGAFHGFDMLTPTAPVCHAAKNTKISWVKRILGEFEKN